MGFNSAFKGLIFYKKKNNDFPVTLCWNFSFIFYFGGQRLLFTLVYTLLHSLISYTYSSIFTIEFECIQKQFLRVG